MKRKWCLIVSILSLTAVAVILIDYMHKRQLREGISCYSQVQYDYVSDKKTVVIQAGIFFLFSNGHGVISYSGTLTDQGNEYTIKRDAEVSYTVSNNNSFLIRTDKLNVAPFDTLPEPLAKKFLYSYIREPNGWTNVGIQRNGENGYLISTNPIPQLLCRFVK
ncbi:hypothetical protein [Serratia fonticola]|uniref:hypothetical protein n=1 Tax=Serratia fonticola TaxID=47917 RepID=UPI000560A151|nr:hypothetical protein [Serratia fonticola]MBP1000045.1 hypothetical protein [Serratia fonticola]MBP1005004.1 hypothetical protein [Serratia fonticola]MBP1014728.1 hypothetical protein [Serratia fonticola]MBP1019755.1 hypothetical protein [Serratia fonticola]MBP1035340.1 hypothetical protein [Serratia fonticola]